MKDGTDESDFPYDCITSSTGEIVGLPPEIRVAGDGLDSSSSEADESIVGSCSFRETLNIFLEDGNK